MRHSLVLLLSVFCLILSVASAYRDDQDESWFWRPRYNFGSVDRGRGQDRALDNFKNVIIGRRSNLRDEPQDQQQQQQRPQQGIAPKNKKKKAPFIVLKNKGFQSKKNPSDDKGSNWIRHSLRNYCIFTPDNCRKCGHFETAEKKPQ